jgi:hypothetical protein
MKVLVACEYSGAVRDAFIRAGHEAMSCDLLPTDVPGPHYAGDVRDVLDYGWDLMIAHPPCTYLSVSGMHWTTRGLRDPQLTDDALDFVRLLMAAPIPRIAVENPVSVISSRIRKPDQIIQPWWFGDDASKKTCLWLKGLNPLVPTKIVPPRGWKLVKFSADLIGDDGEFLDCPDCAVDFADCECYGLTQEGIEYAQIDGFLFGRPEGAQGRATWGNQTPSGQNKLGPSPDRWKIRSATYAGIAQAFADQWGALEVAA